MNFIRRIKKVLNVYKLPYEIKPPYTHLIQIGDPVLRSSCKNVRLEEIATAHIQETINIMLKMLKNDSLCGVSAPQLGVPLRIMAFQCTTQFLLKIFPNEGITQNDMATMEPRVFINPVMKIINYDSNIEPEECGSILGLQAEVKRYNAVQLSGLNELGQQRVVEATGYLARIIQHEMDHLDGILYTDLMTAKTLKCSVWKEINAVNGYVELSYCPRA